MDNADRDGYKLKYNIIYTCKDIASTACYTQKDLNNHKNLAITKHFRVSILYILYYYTYILHKKGEVHDKKQDNLL